jgi:type IV pilus assembly protein PilN
VYLKSIKQEGQRVLLTGYAQSNERVSDFLRAITQQSTWLEKPDLVEIKASTVGAAGKEQKHIFEFSMNVGIKRASDTNTRVPSNDANKPINNATQGIAPAPTITTPTVVAPSVAVPSAVAPSTNSVVKGK